MDPLAKLLARDRIRQLAERCALAVDVRDRDALVALFVPDVDCGRFGSEREPLKASFEGQLRESGPSVMLSSSRAS